MSDARTSAVRDMQTILKVTTNRALKVDGVVGKETRSTYNVANDVTKRVVSDVVRGRGFDADDLLSPVARIERPVTGIANSEVFTLIRKWSAAHGVNVDLATTICGIESRFNPNAVSPTGASGLYQLTAPAIQDVKEKYPGYRDPPAPLGRLDPAWNAEMGIRFIRISAGYAGVSPMSSSIEDWAHIYGTFNLGSGAYKAWRAKKYSNTDLQKSWSSQSSELKRNGIASYGENVLSKLKTVAT